MTKRWGEIEQMTRDFLAKHGRRETQETESPDPGTTSDQGEAFRSKEGTRPAQQADRACNTERVGLRAIPATPAAHYTPSSR
jgi:hypothetical protein